MGGDEPGELSHDDDRKDVPDALDEVILRFLEDPEDPERQRALADTGVEGMRRVVLYAWEGGFRSFPENLSAKEVEELNEAFRAASYLVARENPQEFVDLVADRELENVLINSLGPLPDDRVPRILTDFVFSHGGVGNGEVAAHWVARSNLPSTYECLQRLSTYEDDWHHAELFVAEGLARWDLAAAREILVRVSGSISGGTWWEDRARRAIEAIDAGNVPDVEP
jgi:hypothetical protein